MSSAIPSGPVTTQTELLLDEVASHDPGGYEVFLQACAKSAKQNDGLIYVNNVRELCSQDGRLTIMPQRFSAFYNKAAQEGHLERTGEWQICKGSSSGNDGRPQPIRRWLG